VRTRISVSIFYFDTDLALCNSEVGIERMELFATFFEREGAERQLSLELES
jgi:hypothetical protein